MYIIPLPEDKPVLSSPTKKDKLSNICNHIISAALSLAAMLFAAKWSIEFAANERGYTGAIGGELLVIAFVGIAVYSLIFWLTKEDKRNVR